MPKTKEKLTLKMTQKSVFEVDYNDLNNFVKKIYKDKKYHFVAIQECGNDSSHEFTVDGEIDEYDIEDAVKIKNGEIDIYQNALLLNCLAADGYIPKGDYIISVCW